MNKPELTPFDWDLVHMIKNLIGSQVSVADDIENNRFGVFWSFSKHQEDYAKNYNAIIEAIKGRVGNRYIDTETGNTNITYIQFSPESWPIEKRYDLNPIDEKFGYTYERKVKALRFRDSWVDQVSKFVGGGTHTISNIGAPSTFEFPNQDGMMLKAIDGDFIILEDGLISVVKSEEFEKHFKINL
jgi:hypothetical protein